MFYWSPSATAFQSHVDDWYPSFSERDKIRWVALFFFYKKRGCTDADAKIQAERVIFC